MTRDKYAGRYRLGLNFLFAPYTNPFQTIYMSICPNVSEQDMVF